MRSCNVTNCTAFAPYRVRPNLIPCSPHFRKKIFGLSIEPFFTENIWAIVFSFILKMKPFPNHKIHCILFSSHPFEDCSEVLRGMKTLNLGSVFRIHSRSTLGHHFQGLSVNNRRRPGFCFQFTKVHKCHVTHKFQISLLLCETWGFSLRTGFGF